MLLVKKRLFTNKQRVYLTPNRRLSNYLRSKIVTEFSEQEQYTIDTPEVYPIDNWFTDLWSMFAQFSYSTLNLLTTKQQVIIIEQIISENLSNQILLNISNTAKLVAEAHNWLILWQIPAEKIIEYNNSDNLDFNKFNYWNDLYQDYCNKHNVIDHATAVALLLKLPEDSFIEILLKAIPQNIVLTGFADLPPLYQTFLKKLSENNIMICNQEITSHDSFKRSKDIYRTCSRNEEQEIHQAAIWALKCNLENKNDNICVIIPNLQSIRKEVEHIFAEHFSEDQKSCVNISAPVPLSHYKVIQEALLILDCFNYNLEFSQISQLLHSVFTKEAEAEKSARVMIELKLRKLNEEKISIKRLSTLLNKYAENTKTYAPVFIGIIETIISKLKILQINKNAFFWCNFCENLLEIYAWPQVKYFTKNEYQIITTWKSVFSEYLSLQTILGDHTFFNARSILQKIAQEIPFLPENKNAKINVFGLLEGSGIPFDRIRVLGLSNKAWPQEAKPNPLLPDCLQQQYLMPRSSAQRELEIATRITDDFKKCALIELVFSYPIYIDEMTVGPSSLILDFEYRSTDVIIKQKHNYQNNFLTYTEQVIDNFGTIYKSDDLTGITKGGASLLKTQGECPFKAFAKFRLKAEPISLITYGVSPQIRGEIIHQVLAKFWSVVISYTNFIKLENLDNNDSFGSFSNNINKILLNSINKTLNFWHKKQPHLITLSFIELETQRLNIILMRWLSIEKSRLNFIVKHIEQSQIIKIGELKIRLRLDRVDQDLNGKYIIIDYKTGQVSLNGLFTDRIELPQLALYAIAYKNNIDDLCFAKITAQEQKYLFAKEKISDWQTQIRSWEDKLKLLAEEYVNGYAVANPVKGHNTCKTCDYAKLCRI